MYNGRQPITSVSFSWSYRGILIMCFASCIILSGFQNIGIRYSRSLIDRILSGLFRRWVTIIILRWWSWKYPRTIFTWLFVPFLKLLLQMSCRLCKSISEREFFRRHPNIKKRYFWGGKLWTQSYFVETIGNADEETIRKYVQEQLKQMDGIENQVRQMKLF